MSAAMDRPARARRLRSLPVLRNFLEQAPEMRPLSLRFVEDRMERRYQEAHVRDVLPYIRFAHVLGMIAWALFGPLAQRVLEGDDAVMDAVLRYGIGIPVIAVGLALTYTRWYPDHWQMAMAVLLFASGAAWSLHHILVPSAPAFWSWAGILVVLAFTYMLSREPFVYATVVGAATIVTHTVVMVFLADDRPQDVLYAQFFFLVFAVVGMSAAYGLERYGRLLFLRERQLDTERRRSDALLRNTMPRAIVERLKARDGSPKAGSIADALPDVTVLFADLVGFTERAGRIPPNELVVVLDDVFTAFDGMADRLGLEKIKTVGDAYMAVAGAPEPRLDHAEAAAEMALGIVRHMDGLRWPTGEPMQVRVGVASGAVVAGVIGRRKFAYDLWGDTVNLASRLESSGEPGGVLVAESTAVLLDYAYDLSEPCVLEVKGKGPTRARYLLGRSR